MRSPDQKMESAYDLWAMAKIAEIIGEGGFRTIPATFGLSF